MNNTDLDELVEAALEDGVLTDTERRILDKKAASMGYDLDEFHVLLEGKLQKRQRELRAAQPAPRPASSKHGEVKKCPNCNAVVEPGSVKCPECGYTFRNVEVVSSMARLQEKLDEITSRSTGLGGEIAAQFGLGGSETKHARVIRDFPVPNAKEDLLEFMTCMKNRGDKDFKNMSNTVKGACYLKYMECYEKARLFFADDPQFQPLFAEAEKQKKKLTKFQLIAISYVAVIVIGIVLYAIFR